MPSPVPPLPRSVQGTGGHRGDGAVGEGKTGGKKRPLGKAFNNPLLFSSAASTFGLSRASAELWAQCASTPSTDPWRVETPERYKMGKE